MAFFFFVSVSESTVINDLELGLDVFVYVIDNGWSIVTPDFQNYAETAEGLSFEAGRQAGLRVIYVSSKLEPKQINKIRRRLHGMSLGYKVFIEAVFFLEI